MDRRETNQIFGLFGNARPLWLFELVFNRLVHLNELFIVDAKKRFISAQHDVHHNADREHIDAAQIGLAFACR